MEKWRTLYPTAPQWALELFAALVDIAEQAKRNRDEKNWLRASQAANRIFWHLEAPDAHRHVIREVLEVMTGYTAHITD
jgi:hypothetical protein